MSEYERIKTIVPQVEKELGSTFCFAKWYHLNIYLQNGTTHSCYHPPPHKIDENAIKINPAALHNTDTKKEERRQMLNNEKPSGCNYCWNIENLGKDHISDRHIRTASIHTPERQEEVKKKGWQADYVPEYIEISFGNECNFKCGYCHPLASSRWWNEIKQHGPYENVSQHNADIEHLEIFEEETNPYVAAFWRWWPEIKDHLNILRITGGEPLMQKSTFKVFDKLSEDPNPNLNLSINSNLGIKHNFVKRMVEQVNELQSQNKVKSFSLYTSIDVWGPKAEFIRTGLDLKLFEKNLLYILDNSDITVSFMITFNIFCVTGFDTLLNKILEWRKKYGRRIQFDTPYLKEPVQFDMNILPKSFMSFMYNHLELMKANQDDSDETKFTLLEVEKFKRVVDYMESKHYSEDYLIQGRKDFYFFFEQYNKRRNVDYRSTFPEMDEFFKICDDIIFKRGDFSHLK